MRKIKTAPHLPTEMTIERRGPNSVVISIFPFESGYGITLAHPLKRLLLSSSVGYAPTGIKIAGARHEFDSIRGVLEDVSELIINLKNIRFKIKDESKKVVLHYAFSGHREVKGADLQNELVEVASPEAHLATLNSDGTLEFSLIIEKGMGYVPSESIRPVMEEGYLPLDAFFMPIKKAVYAIEHVLVEDSPDYEKVVFEIVTDGQADPVTLFKDAVETMYRQMSIFGKELGIQAAFTDSSADESESDLKKLLVSIDDLNLSARSHNCLIRSNIKYVGDLVLMSEKGLAEVKNLGKKSLDEIKQRLEEYGFPVGSELPEPLLSALKQKLTQLKG
ncbi:MAG: DNA-directed RNA polymerase subunit alpha [Campylobacterales bacterium]